MQVRSVAAALVAAAALAFPARHAAAQGITQDAKNAADAVGHTASKVGKGTAKVAVKAADATADEGKKIGKGTAHVAVKAADATAGEGKKVGRYVKHRVSKPRRRTTPPDSASH